MMTYWKTTFIASSLFLASQSALAETPKLVLQITVDQLKASMLYQQHQAKAEQGFEKLLTQGAVFTNAHHQHANTETIVGHVTLATGTTPSVHGLVSNAWFDKQTNKIRYNVEDAKYPLLSADADVNKNTEIDPSQKAASADGRSPRSIVVNTIADQISLANQGKSKVFSVSVKDRGAISMAGHSGKAFWFSKASKQFISSRYYFDSYPQWVNEWNSLKKADEYQNTQWHLSEKKSQYRHGHPDDNHWELDLAGYGRKFPHDLGDSKYFSTLLTASPFADKLVVDFAKSMIKKEQIGKDDVTDYLAISLSATDYIGHFFGPSSLESEENLKQLDSTIMDLLTFVDKEVGLDNTLVVLSSDHGAPDAPDYLATMNIPGASFDAPNWETLPQIEALKNKYGIKKNLFSSYMSPYLYLNEQSVAAANIDQYSLSDEIAKAIESLESVFTAIGSHHIEKGTIAKTQVNKKVANNYYAGRSGDIHVVFKPQNFINKFGKISVASTHGSPWNYDTHVPLIFLGKGIKPGTYSKPVATIDVAPTIATLANVSPPNGATGKSLAQKMTKLNVKKK